MESAIRKIVAEFDLNPILAAKGLRTLLEKDGKVFFEAALKVIRALEDSQGLHYLLTLLLTQGAILTALCDPREFTLEEATALARRMRDLDPQFDVRLLRSVVRNNGSSSPQELETLVGSPSGMRMLDLLGAVSDGTRVLTTMTQLLSHPNSHVRSKAALLVGRSNKNHKWVQERLEEADARVRANAVESLWGSDTAGSHAVFRVATSDEDNRVVGNAALGLYRQGDAGSIKLILEMFADERPDFRSTAIWVMGETEDPRFVPMLARVLGEPGPELRGAALRAMAHLKKAIAKRTASPPLHVIAGPPRPGEGEWLNFSAALRAPRQLPLQELDDTGFALWEDAEPVKEYAVRHRGKSEPIAIALAFPRVLDRSSPLQTLQELAAEQALRHKRRHDLWMSLKYLTASQEQPGSKLSLLRPGDEDLSAARMRFTTDPNALADAVASPGARLGCALDLHQATRTLIEAAGLVRAIRNVVLVCEDPSDVFSASIREQSRAAYETYIAVHAITPWPDAAMKLCARKPAGPYSTSHGSRRSRTRWRSCAPASSTPTRFGTSRKIPRRRT